MRCSKRARICQWTDAAANPLVSRPDSFGSAFFEIRIGQVLSHLPEGQGHLSWTAQNCQGFQG